MRKIPWVEKYRPTDLDQIVYQSESTQMFRNSILTNNLPHMLLYGPPGTGKTTTIMIAAKMLFGPTKVHDRVIELNASDDRGINVVRTKIMNFAKENLSTPDPNYPSPQFKIIILDEADSMTKEAQSALKKIIEINSKITRFCLICNYITKIIDPIQSRCSKFRFKSIIPGLISDRLKHIAKSENLSISKDNLEIIAKNSSGDMRKAIMYLQNLKYLNGIYGKMSVSDIYKSTNQINPDIIQNILKKCFRKDNNIHEIMRDLNDLWKGGCVMTNVLETVTNIITENSNLTDLQKDKICFHIASTDRMLINCADEFIQLVSVFGYIKSVYFDYPTTQKIDIL